MKLIGLFILVSFFIVGAERKVDYLISKGKYKRVIKYIDKKYKDKNDEEILYNYGFAQEHIGNYEEALNCYHLISRTCPNNSLILSSLGRVYIQLNEFEKAYTYTLRSVMRDTLTEKTMLQHAFVCFKLNKLKAAKKIFEKYKECEESNVLGFIYFKEKQFKKAIPFLIKYLNIKNEDEAAIKLAFCFLSIEQYDSSIFYLSTDFGRKRERLKKVEEIALRLNKKYPMNKKIIMLLANLSIEQKSLDDAMEYCKLISYIDSNDVKAIYKRADIYVLKNDIELARKYYLKGADLLKKLKGIK
jgi:tetratricopeptide (TPR) repeat protein